MTVTISLLRALLVPIGVLLVASRAALAQGVVLPLPPEEQQQITAQLGSGVVGNALPSKPIEDASVYFPFQDKTLTYQVTSGSNIGNTQRLGLAKTRRQDGKSAWRFQLSPSLAGFIRQTPEGDLIMPAVSDAEEGVLVVATPANPFVPKGMKPGETRAYSQQVSVNYLDDPAHQKYSGTLNGTHTYVGTYQVTVPAGTYGAVLFRMQCEGKIGPAHTQNRAYNFFAPGVGMVAMILQEAVTAFWIYHSDTTTGIVLMSR